MTHFDEPQSTGEAPRSAEAPDLRREKGFQNLAVHALARIADQHFRCGQTAAEKEAMRTPHVIALARALADADDPHAEAMVQTLLEDGVSIEDLCADHLAPAARELGHWWEIDEMSFTEVTLATARMQTILRKLPGARGPMSISPSKGALFAAVPGEEHTLGVLMAADHFRRLGWDVGLLVGMDHAEMLARVLDDDRPLLGLSCTAANSVESLRRLIEDIRHRRSDIAIVVAGGVARDTEALSQLPPLDGVVSQLNGAEPLMRAAIRATGALQTR